jgi:hypothetical protein
MHINAKLQNFVPLTFLEAQVIAYVEAKNPAFFPVGRTIIDEEAEGADKK